MNHKVGVKGVTVANQWLQTAKRVDSVSAPHTLPLISPDQLDLWFNQIKSSVSNTLWSTEFIWLHFYKILNAGWAAASLEQVTPCEAVHWKQQHCLHPQLCPHSPDCPTFKKPILLVFPHSFGAMFLAEIFLAGLHDHSSNGCFADAFAVLPPAAWWSGTKRSFTGWRRNGSRRRGSCFKCSWLWSLVRMKRMEMSLLTRFSLYQLQKFLPPFCLC